MSYGLYFFISLVLTLVVELPMLFVVGRHLLKIKLQTKEILYWGIVVNLFSLPYLWFVFPLFITSHSYILIGEIMVVIIETGLLSKALKINIKNAFVMSLIANIASYLSGIILLR